MRNRTLFQLLVVVGVGLGWATLGPKLAFAEPVTLLHKFAGGNNDGDRPFAGLTLSGTTLFGTTFFGGDDNRGTLFSIKTDGTGFTLLHKFAGGNNDGARPEAGLTLSGTTLFGATQAGGNSDLGTLFSIKTDGTGFTLLRKFAGGNNDGALPSASLALSGTTLFGTTEAGGNSDRGTLFSIKTDGTGFTLLRRFAGGDNDGARPEGGVTLSGTTLFGTTNGGGEGGTLFTSKTDGTLFTLLHKFTGGNNDGLAPFGGVTLSGTTLFGTTQAGGNSNRGTLFSIKTDGTGFTLLHKFAGGNNDGSNPTARLTLSGTTLFGTTFEGGTDDMGTLFSVQTDGTGFTLLHSFGGGNNDGSNPTAGVTLSGTTLFGTTQAGGNSNRGTVFSFVVPEPPSLVLFGFGTVMVMTMAALGGRFRAGRCVRAGLARSACR